MGAGIVALLSNPAFWTATGPILLTLVGAVAHLKTGGGLGIISMFFNGLGLKPAVTTPATDPVKTAAEQATIAIAGQLGVIMPPATLDMIADEIVDFVEAQFSGGPQPSVPQPSTPPSNHPIISGLANLIAGLLGQPAASADVQAIVGANMSATLAQIIAKYPATPAKN